MALKRGVLQTEGRRPWTLTVVAISFFSFSGYALFVLVSGASHMRSNLSDAWFPLLVCLTAAALPAVLGLGLWMMDNAARIGGIFLLGLHAASTLAWIEHTANMTAPRPEIRLVFDAILVALLLSQSARSSCRWEMRKLFDQGANLGSGATPLPLTAR